VAALQAAAGADGVGEGAVPGLQAAQVPERQGAPAAGGRPHGAAGKTAADTPQGASVSRTNVSRIDGNCCPEQT